MLTRNTDIKTKMVSYNDLHEILEKPPIYKKSACKFWDDEYISKQMLAAHLDPDFEAASRKMDFIDKSATWISKICPPEEFTSLLDMGCGPGIYAEKFAKAGYKVTGVDFSQRSIHYAKQAAEDKGLNITYHYQNYLEMDLQEQFDLITFIYCDYGALSIEDRKTIMDRTYKHLKPGGKLLLDVFTPVFSDKKKESTDWYDCKENGFWREGEHIALNRCCKYPGHVTLDMTVIITETEITPYYIWDTAFTKEELTAEAEKSCFQVCGVYGDVAGAKYTKNSDTIAILLQKKCF